MIPRSLPCGLAALFLIAAVPAVAQTLGEDAALCGGGHGPAIEVRVQGLKDRAGQLWVELYPGQEADFLRDDTALMQEGKIFRRVRTPLPAAGTVAVCVGVPRPGRYALLVRHNRTGKDKFSFWSDGAGFPANRAIGRSRPQFGHAVIDAAGGVTVATVHMQYLHGLRGFAPN